MINLLNKKVRHSGALGVGTVIDQNEKYITVQFSSKTCKFQFPAAFEKFLIPENEDVKNEIQNEMDAIKAAEEAKKAEEAARKAAEEQAKLDALKANAKHVGKQSGSSKQYVPAKRVSGQPLTFLVFQGDTYTEECRGQFIWAPKYTKAGGTCHHWDRLMSVREGDVILHCADGYIQAISRARGPFEDSARPDKMSGDWTQWEKDGRRVDCDYYVLRNPLKHGAYKDTIREYCNVKYAPFDKDGNGNMGYLFDIDPRLAAFFVQEIAKKNAGIIDLDFLRFLLVKEGGDS